MAGSMLKLPRTVRMDGAAAVWTALSASLRAEGAQVRSAAGAHVQISAADLQEFDSAALSVLLSAARLCGSEGVTLQVRDAPPKLRKLARVYGVGVLLWADEMTSRD